jgi:hypothetical protein
MVCPSTALLRLSEQGSPARRQGHPDCRLRWLSSQRRLRCAYLEGIVGPLALNAQPFVANAQLFGAILNSRNDVWLEAGLAAVLIVSEKQ